MTDKQEIGKNLVEIRDVEPELNAELMKHFTGEKTGYIRVGSKGYVYNSGFKREAQNIYSLPLKSNDIFIVTFPRSGTTWTQELVWLIQNDLNYAKATTIPLVNRYVFLEMGTLMHTEMAEKLQKEDPDDEARREIINSFTFASATELLANMPSPRYAKTHLPLSLLPPNLLDTCKVVYVARDVRDVAVSFYHLHKLIKFYGYFGDFKTFWNFFMRDLITFAPFFEHVKEAWKQRHHPNMLFLFYEELIKDLPATVRRVADFFGKKYDDEQFAGLCEHLAFKNIKNNKAVNNSDWLTLGIFQNGEQLFIRKGKSGGWREYFDEEMSAQAEQWIQENLKDTDLRFPAHD